MERRDLILRTGGRHLLLAFLRFHPSNQANPRLLDPKAVLSEGSHWGERMALASQDSTFQSAGVDPLFWKPHDELTEEDIEALKRIFKLSVTMTPQSMRAWAKDPRFVDTVRVQERGSFWKAQRRLLEIARMRATTTTVWGPRETRIAQEVGFVVQSLNVTRFVDYYLWALLRTYGSRWEYPNLPYMRRRPLPLRVVLEKEAALLLRQKAGRPLVSP